ncbi:MAG: hypothetical protein AB198_02865, partial [Parcubacteria bacterium C7867-003]
SLDLADEGAAYASFVGQRVLRQAAYAPGSLQVLGKNHPVAGRLFRLRHLRRASENPKRRATLFGRPYDVFEVHFGGIPNTKNMKLFDKSSIVKNLQKLQKPLFVFHGDLDNQVPFSQSEYLFKESQKIGKDIKYFSVKNQGHVISGVSQNEAICNKLAEMLKISTTTEFCVMN